MAGSQTIPGVSVPNLSPILEMPRMPRAQGPKPIVETVSRPGDVAIQSIVRLLPDEQPEKAVERRQDDADEYDDAVGSSLRLEVEVDVEEHSTPNAAPLVAADLFETAAASAPTVSAWPTEAAPVSAADSIRPALSPVVIPPRRLWPWALAAVALLGLGTMGAAVAWIGPSAIADYVDEPGDLFAQIENLDLLDDPEALPGAAGSTETPSTLGAAVNAPAPSTSVEAPSDEAGEMVFGLAEAEAEANDSDTSSSRRNESPRARRRADRREVQQLIQEADGSATAEEAATRYEAVLARDPHNAVAMRSLARAKIAMGDYADAVTWARRATQSRPRHAPSWGTLGDALRRTGDEAGAQAAYDRARELDPVPSPSDEAPSRRAPSHTETETEPDPHTDLDLDLNLEPEASSATEETPPQASTRPPDQLTPRARPALPPAL
jgi:hypothetical protein